MSLRINFTGCSGIGKTTLAKALAKENERYGTVFVSGSYSDLVPETRDMPHTDMIQQDAKTVFEQDVKVLGIRKKLFEEHPILVSDRSYIDSAAYMIQKLSHRLPTCEIEDFIEKCRVLTLRQCDYVVYLPYTGKHFTEWNIEDNGKRVLNKFYQAEVTAIIDYLLGEYWHCEIKAFIDGNPVMVLDDPKLGYTPILVLSEIDHKKRMEIINSFLCR